MYTYAAETGTSPFEVAGAVDRALQETPYVHLMNVGVVDLDPTSRADRIRSISAHLGEVTLTNDDPRSNLWVLDSHTSPNAMLVPCHTDNPFMANPEDVVAFWNIHSSSIGGENVIVPLDRLLELGEQSSEIAELIDEASTTPLTFTSGTKHYTGTPIDVAAGTIRYDKKHLSTPSTRLAYLFDAALDIGDVIKLQPDEALFFRNRTTLHARLPYSDPNRLSIRTRIAY